MAINNANDCVDDGGKDTQQTSSSIVIIIYVSCMLTGSSLGSPTITFSLWIRKKWKNQKKFKDYLLLCTSEAKRWRRRSFFHIKNQKFNDDDDEKHQRRRRYFCTTFVFSFNQIILCSVQRLFSSSLSIIVVFCFHNVNCFKFEFSFWILETCWFCISL